MSFSPPTLQLLTSVYLINNLIENSYYKSFFEKTPRFEQQIKFLLEHDDEQLCVNLYWHKEDCEVRTVCKTPYDMHTFLQNRYASDCTSVAIVKRLKPLLY
jgi:hypothetical protein